MRLLILKVWRMDRARMLLETAHARTHARTHEVIQDRHCFIMFHAINLSLQAVLAALLLFWQPLQVPFIFCKCMKV